MVTLPYAIANLQITLNQIQTQIKKNHITSNKAFSITRSYGQRSIALKYVKCNDIMPVLGSVLFNNKTQKSNAYNIDT